MIHRGNVGPNGGAERDSRKIGLLAAVFRARNELDDFGAHEIRSYVAIATNGIGGGGRDARKRPSCAGMSLVRKSRRVRLAFPTPSRGMKRLLTTRRHHAPSCRHRSAARVASD
jgi:hypothetical protein